MKLVRILALSATMLPTGLLAQDLCGDESGQNRIYSPETILGGYLNSRDLGTSIGVIDPSNYLTNCPTDAVVGDGLSQEAINALGLSRERGESVFGDEIYMTQGN